MIALLVTAAWVIPLIVGVRLWIIRGRRWRICVIGHRNAHDAGISLALKRGFWPRPFLGEEVILVGYTNLKNDGYLEEWFELKDRAATMRRELNA